MIKSKIWTGQRCVYAHEKLDGHSLKVCRNAAGTIRMLTRKPVDETKRLETCGWAASLYSLMPSQCTIYGELWVPGRNASYVKTAMINSPEELRFNGFAIHHKDVNDLTPLSEVNQRLLDYGVATIPYLININNKYDGLGGKGFFNWTTKSVIPLPFDIEGYVLKNGNMTDWYKLKPTKTIDLIVKGLKAAKPGKFFGMVGALICETSEGKEIASVSGMNDLVRKQIGFEDIGRVVEVSYQYVGDKGRLRHPNFVRWRDDKKVCECKLEQDPKLVEYWK